MLIRRRQEPEDATQGDEERVVWLFSSGFSCIYLISIMY